MKSILKRSLSFLLAITLVFSSAYVGLSEVDFSSLFAVKAEAAGASALRFALNSDKNSYSVDDCDMYATGSLTIPSTYKGKPVTRIGDQAFEYCTGLTSIVIPNSVTSIGARVFGGCDNIKKVSIPDSVTIIGDGAFGGLNITSITIPNSVKSIGYRAFAYCESLKSITIPDSVTKIGSEAFYCCRGLTNVKISNSITSINEATFGHCSSLKSIVIPKSITSIGFGAFTHCKSLEQITIPGSVTSIGDQAFRNCTRLASITVDSANKKYCSVDGVLFNKGRTKLIQYPQGKTNTTFTIPYGTKSIENYAFYNCPNLTSISIPNSVTSIGDNAFYSCTGLTSMTIPDSVTSIGCCVIYDCTSLESITIPDSVTNINVGNFYECPNIKFVFYTGSKSKWNAINMHVSCTESLKNAKIHYNATGHVSSTWIIDKKATVNSTGLKHKVCKVCGAKFASTVIPQLKPATPKLSAVTNTVSGVKFTWGKVTGADSYVVYRRTYNPSTKKWGGWVNLAKGIKTTYYVDKTAKSGVYYIYTVKAANEAGYSGFNTTGLKTFFLSTPKLSSVTNSSAGVTVKWGKVAGATNYVVYRKAYNPTTKKWGDWVNVAKGVKTNSYMDKTAKSGVYYIYTVRALAGTNMGSYNTTGLKTYFLSTPVLSKATSTTSGVKFTWGKTAGANGYIVYRRTYNASTKKWNGWSKLATVSGNSKVSYVDKSAKKGCILHLYHKSLLRQLHKRLQHNRP